jgi:hypothetical protein
MRFGRSVRVVAFLAAALTVLGGCASGDEVSPAAGSRDTPPTAECSDTGFPCDLRDRFAAADSYVSDRPGTTGIVVHDLRTGAVWQNSHAGDPTWTASTIKLAMVVDLFTRSRSGALTLTDEDRTLIHAMLHTSDDDAADTLWYRYAGADHRAFNDNFPRYGLTSLHAESGYTEYFPYWGFQKCTPLDLDRLMTHVLTKLPAGERSYLVKELRTVAPVQRWGVWGAGPAAHPGNKNGWSEEDGGWVMNTVGFVGEDERYVLTVMNDLHGEGGYDAGRATVTRVSALIFGGYFG